MGKKWQFWIDRGGTFTDIIAKPPDTPLISAKFLSEDPKRYDDAAIFGMRSILGLSSNAPFPHTNIDTIRMGTTVATNALLERQGAKTALVTTAGFEDALKIGTQNRPELFALHIQKPEPLYDLVIGAKERISAEGKTIEELDEHHIENALRNAKSQDIKAIAICLVHGYLHHSHEKRIRDIANSIGFEEVTASHDIAPLIKFIPRAQTALINAYLTPVLRHYISKVADNISKTPLYFMQSNGGLAHKDHFLAKDAILSGPAGGIIGAVETAKQAGFDKIIAFDMGGTSTDVSHYAGQLEYNAAPSISGQKLHTAMLDIHTIAAGGGSQLSFDGIRLRVGPQSSGSNPGPASYGKGGRLSLTDCHVVLGRLPVAHFPHILGNDGQSPLDIDAARTAMGKLQAEIGRDSARIYTIEALAEGYLDIATEHMARAIKAITIERGQDIEDHVLVAFGGAGGQMACRVADALSVRKIMIHPMAGVLSALGIGLAKVTVIREQSFQTLAADTQFDAIDQSISRLIDQALSELNLQVTGQKVEAQAFLHLRYQGSDTSLPIAWSGDLSQARGEFEQLHAQRFGFKESATPIEVDKIAVSAQTSNTGAKALNHEGKTPSGKRCGKVETWVDGSWIETDVFQRADLKEGVKIPGPAILLDPTSTTCVDAGWFVQIDSTGALILDRDPTLAAVKNEDIRLDPIKLEIFNNLFMSIAEQMGVVLENTAHSVNIKERLDFSCALFDKQGDLVANAPHMPVHLGSMSECVKALIAEVQNFKPGSAFAINDPYHGGTHLPDITVVTPVFIGNKGKPHFYVASRGHHADVGGITPGSMPAHSTSIAQEGALFRAFPLVKNGEFQDKATREIFNAPPYPARNINQNIADLKAQIAANAKGVQEIHKMIGHFGSAQVNAYMKYIQNAAEQAVCQAIGRLKSGSWTYPMDIGVEIKLSIDIDPLHNTATIDFSGTSLQGAHNFNAPLAITRAAVLYVFRCLVDDDIPLNAGCLKPIKLIVPKGCLLNPIPPAAVVAGNVETSQAVTNALLLAMNVAAASQGTMNNLSFGNEDHQYYETLAGGTGAGPGFNGADAVHSHMTNSRLTDVEIIETRLPVDVVRFLERQDSGGDGQYHGGNGLIRHLRFKQDMTATLLSNHRISGPPGLQDGENGKVGEGRLIRSNGEEEIIGACAEMQVKTGDELVIETPGGGGYGAKRPPLSKL